jgi:uncharacterized Zn-binding protein involved in type VI secretion
MPAQSSGTVPTTGHGCFPPTSVSGTASTVLVNGKPAVVVGDGPNVHTCVRKPYPTHGSSVSAGSGTVIIEGKPAGRISDPIGCGSVIAGGSSNVFSGG